MLEAVKRPRPRSAVMFMIHGGNDDTAARLDLTFGPTR